MGKVKALWQEECEKRADALMEADPTLDYEDAWEQATSCRACGVTLNECDAAPCDEPLCYVHSKSS